MKLERLCFNINGVDRFITCDPENDTLAEVLRRMGLTGVKVGCGTGVCGACSVILDGEVVRACTKKMKRVAEFCEITHHRGHRHPAAPASLAAGLDHLRRRPVRLLLPGLHRVRLRSAGGEPRPHPRRRAQVVQGPPQHLPLHRLHTPGRRRHGRRRGHARREDHGRHHLRLRGRDRDLRLAAVRGPTALAKVTRPGRLRRRRRPADAPRHRPPGRRPGRGPPRQHPQHRHGRSRSHARRHQGAHRQGRQGHQQPAHAGPHRAAERHRHPASSR